MAVTLLSKCDWPSTNQQNKEKVFLWASNILESLQSICSEHIKLLHSTQFHPLQNQNCQSWWISTHTFLCTCVKGCQNISQIDISNFTIFSWESPQWEDFKIGFIMLLAFLNLKHTKYVHFELEKQLIQKGPLVYK